MTHSVRHKQAANARNQYVITGDNVLTHGSPPLLASFSLCAVSLYHQMQQVQMAVPCVFHNQNHNKPDNYVSKVPYSRIP